VSVGACLDTFLDPTFNGDLPKISSNYALIRLLLEFIHILLIILHQSMWASILQVSIFPAYPKYERIVDIIKYFPMGP
jgi:hypothetical protein